MYLGCGQIFFFSFLQPKGRSAAYGFGLISKKQSLSHCGDVSLVCSRGGWRLLMEDGCVSSALRPNTEHRRFRILGAQEMVENKSMNQWQIKR